LNKLKTLILVFIFNILLSNICFSLELRVLCWEGYADKAYVKQFEEYILTKYKEKINIKVNDVSDPQEFYDGIRSKNVDLISPAHNIPRSHKWNMIRNEMVLPLNLENIPNFKNIIPAIQKIRAVASFKSVYGVPIVYGPYGLFYNTKILKSEPKSWDIFWDKKWKGKYSISSDYHEANIYSTLLAMGIPSEHIFDITAANTILAKKKLRYLAKNAANFWVGVDSAEKLKGLAFATGWGFALPALKKLGEEWKLASPKEGTTGWVDHWMIGYSLKDKPKLKLYAEEWINFSISPKIQASYVKNIGQFPVNTKVKSLLTKSQIKQFHLDDPRYVKNNLILWRVLGRAEQEGFKSLWQKAKE
jgi:spermidine/putrescine transport system substrate-binding protein